MDATSECSAVDTPSDNKVPTGIISPDKSEIISPDKELEKKESGTVLKRGLFNKSKPSLPQKSAPTPLDRNQNRAYLSFLFTLNLFAWDVLLFKNHIKTILILGGIIFAVILTCYPLLHCLVLILLLGFAVSIVYSAFLLLFRIIVGKPASHPFRHLLSQTETQIDPALLETWTISILEVFGPLLNLLLSLVLFYDLRMSIAFSVLLYLTSYVTIYITLPYILIALLFTCFIAPKIYVISQASVDNVIGKLLEKYKKIAAKIERVVDTE
ncbi:hypothetical protein LOD99_629 [Oopsacas minuta]|uniref:Reticulon-like protein n=1 Tax=Oopsacas minuta TaxID=111878 RepID=A0AAV7K0E6_9METZ|nr:hypothetical protein LOD99_629 [Oopsacas minuta]